MAEAQGGSPLYSVEFALNIERRAFAVFCCFPDPKQASIRVGDTVEFVRPDKSVVRATVRGINMVMDARPGLVGLDMSDDVQKDDIPLGTMLRLLRHGGADEN